MGSTTSLGIPYPDSTDDVNPPADLQALAAQVDTILATLKTPPSAQLKGTTTQSLVNNTITQMSLDTVQWDNASMADLANNQLVVPLAGLYQIIGVIAFTAVAATNARASYIYAGPSGSPVIINSGYGAAVGASTATIVNVSTFARLNLGDVIQLKGYQNSGAALNSANSNGCPLLSATWIGA